MLKNQDNSRLSLDEFQNESQYIAWLAKKARDSYGERYGRPEITQREYGQVLGTKGGTVQAWESGINTPKAQQFALLAWDAGLSADDAIARLISIEKPNLRDRIPEDLRERREISRLEILETLDSLPTQDIFDIQRKAIEVMQERLQDLGI